MNLIKINTVAYKTITIIVCAGLVVLAISIAWRHLFVKAGIVLVAAAIAGMLNSSKPTFKSWLLLLGTSYITVNIVGLLDKL